MPVLRRVSSLVIHALAGLDQRITQAATRWPWLQSRLPRRHAGALAFAGMALAGITISQFLPSDSTAAPPGAGSWVQVEPEADRQPLVVTGVVSPSKTVDVVAQIDGTVVQVLARPGDIVTEGQPLLEIDARDLRSQLAEAEAALLRGEQEMKTLRTPSGNAELQAALRRQAMQRASAAVAKRRLAEANALHKHGIIARDELEAAENEQRMAQDQLLGANEEVRSASAKLGPGMVRAAELELEVKRSKYEQLQAKAKRTMMPAPVAGVLLPPPPDKTGAEEGKLVREGTALTGSEVLYSIGDLTTPMVRLSVGESDVVKLRVGQAAEVRLPSLPNVTLAAKVDSVSALARRGASRSGGAQAEFDVAVRITDPFPEPAGGGEGGVYFGTSAEASIALAFDEEVFSVPIAAIRWDAAGQAMAWVRPAGSETFERRRLDIVQMGVEQAVVRSGVAAGELVWSGSSTIAPEPPARRLQWLRDLFNVNHDDAE